MNAIELLQKVREAQTEDSAPEETTESRQIVLSPEELLALGRQGIQEGGSLSAVVSGTLSGGVITISSIQVMGPLRSSNVDKAFPPKAPIVRMNPAPYPG